MKSQLIQHQKTHPLRNVLAMSLSAIMTVVICTSTSTYASDIDIYQEAKSGDITLMFMLDVSTSMNDYDSGQIGSRWTRVQVAMSDLLNGNAAKKIEKIGDDKIIGLSTLGAISFNSSGNLERDSENRGAIIVPARRLDTQVSVDGTVMTQRQLLVKRIDSIRMKTSTPTARSYAETIAYLMGVSTKDKLNSGWSYSASSTKTNGGYVSPSSLTQTDEVKKCSGQGIYVLTDGEPNNYTNTSDLAKQAIGNSSFYCNSDSYNSYNRIWDCTNKLNEALIDPKKNGKGLKFKTAVVGFGNAFNNIASYDQTKTQEQNLDALGDLDSHPKYAARWGILGEGGWYSGNSSQDVVNSVNNFINGLGAEIPAVTTGTPTIPLDQLNPTVLQNYAYYPQFEPTPDKTYQLWAGNLKKYNVDVTGKLRDKAGNLITDSTGKIIDNYDLWAPTLGSNPTDIEKTAALIGGMKMKLDLRHTGSETAQRKLLTTREYVSATNSDSSTLQQVKITDLDDATKKKDPKIGYLMNLLGYGFDPKFYIANNVNTLTKVQLLSQPEFRQIGAVMHSSPILLTNQGKITYSDTTNAIGSEDRQDYILFGTTQGLLHVVDAVTGKEKFAFVPNELVENQAEAFNKPELTSGGIHQMYYGVDGPWTAYTEYVMDKDDSDKLSVGTGKPYTVVENDTNVEKEVKGKQLVYGGLRMGGKSYYALDLSNIDAPKLQFQIKPSGTCSATNPLGCMGQSWSKPSIAWVNWKGTKKLVMFVGGGYDAEGVNVDNSNHKIADKYKGYEYDDYIQSNKVGAGVYMFDALNGELLWWAGANTENDTINPTSVPATGVASSYNANMQYSVVSQIRTIDRDSDGLTDHLYFGDLGGQVWRIDLNNQAGGETTVFARTPTRILSINNGKFSPRFYETPAFSTYSQNGTIFGVISIGSGNRSKPLAEYTYDVDKTGVTDYSYDSVYNVYDKDVARESLLKTTEKGGVKSFQITDDNLITKNITLQSESTMGITSESSKKLLSINDNNRFTRTETIAPFLSTQGWYFKFKSFKVQSEKVMSTPVVINNDMYVTTFDGSKPGLSGDCGAGVKGESFMTLFCMPFGQCNSGSTSTYRLNLGAGIVGGAIGAGDGSGMQRLIVANVDTTNVNSEILKKRYKTANKLIPQRWYER